MKEDLSLIKRYPIVEYLERKGIKPVRRTPAYALYRSPLREETHPSFKVDTEKNLWIDYAEGRGGSIIDLCMRMERCSLSEAIRLLGRNAPDTTCSPRMVCVHGTSNQESIGQATSANGTRRLTGISDTLPPHLQDYLMKERYIDLAKAKPFLKCISYEVRGQHYQAIGFANQSGGYELRDSGSFKGTIAPKDITPIFMDRSRNKVTDKKTTSLCVRGLHGLPFFPVNERRSNECLSCAELRKQRCKGYPLSERQTPNPYPCLP